MSFADASQLTSFISTDWTGELGTLDQATWSVLPVLIAQKEDEAATWIDSGPFSLKDYPSFFLAFRYNGSGKTASDGTYEIDDIRVYEGQ